MSPFSPSPPAPLPGCRGPDSLWDYDYDDDDNDDDDDDNDDNSDDVDDNDDQVREVGRLVVRDSAFLSIPMGAILIHSADQVKFDQINNMIKSDNMIRPITW